MEPDPSVNLEIAPEEAYLQPFRALYAGFAAPFEVEGERRASGGLATHLLALALEKKMVDGVVLCRADFSSRKVGYVIDIETDPKAIPSYGSSAYFNIPLERHWATLESFEGRLAVCGLPCHIGILDRRRASGKGLQNVALTISLFCGHNNQPALIDFFLRKEGIDPHQLTDFRVRRSYLGGHIEVGMRDGTLQRIPFRRFNVYRSLWFFSKPMCRLCNDHLGKSADISVGDIFTGEFRSRAKKHSAAIIRTEIGEQLWAHSQSTGRVTAEAIQPAQLFAAQKRILVPAADMKSRYYAMKAAGYAPRGQPEGRFRLRSYLTYRLMLANDRLSQKSWGPGFIRRIPRPLLYAYIAVLKLINNTLKP